MMIHELIDRNVPYCLYCGAAFDTNAISIRSSSAYINQKMGHPHIMRSDAETLYCVDCKEKFEIYSHQKDDGETEYTGFTFTCNGLDVFCIYASSTFEISNLKGEHVIAIPAFEPDFTDRNKLHEKLRTYLLFS